MIPIHSNSNCSAAIWVSGLRPGEIGGNRGTRYPFPTFPVELPNGRGKSLYSIEVANRPDRPKYKIRRIVGARGRFANFSAVTGGVIAAFLYDGNGENKGNSNDRAGICGLPRCPNAGQRRAPAFVVGARRKNKGTPPARAIVHYFR
jgi:hypothetical protein